MKNSESYLLATTDPSIKVQARITQIQKGKNKGKCYIHGYLIHAASGLKVDSMKPKAMPYRESIEAAKADRMVLSGRLMADYENICKPAISTAAEPFRIAFDAVADKQVLCLGADWTFESTGRRYLTYFSRKVIPRLDTFGHDILPRDMLTIKDALVQLAFESKRSHGDRDSVNISVSQYLAAANVILSNLYAVSQPGAIPLVEFDLDTRQSPMAYEQVKALTPIVRTLLAYALYLFPSEKSGIALGTAMMYYGGLRPAEAARPCFGNITIHNDGAFASYYVDEQLRSTGIISSPKTDAGQRTIVLPHAFVVMLQNRMSYLTHAGFSADAIKEMPLVSTDNPESFAGPDAISTFTKELMARCGFGDNRNLQIAMKYEPLYDADGVPVSDPRAYILRRDWCSRLINICGVEKDVVDYMMGHKNPNSKITKDAMNQDTLCAIADAMERFVGVPEASLHPVYRPRKLFKNTRSAAVPKHNAFALQAECAPDESVFLRLTLRCDEPQDSLMIRSEGAAAKIDVRNPDTLHPQDPVIGAPYDPSFYDACRLAASDILQRWDIL